MLDLKPNKKTRDYANKFIESNGGYQKFFEAFQNQSKETTSRKGKSSKLKRQSSESSNNSIKSNVSRRAIKINKKSAPKPYAVEVVANIQSSMQSQQNYSYSALPSPLLFSASPSQMSASTFSLVYIWFLCFH